MKATILFLLLLVTITSLGQQPTQDAPSGFSPEVKATIQLELGISMELTEKVLNVISASNSKMKAVASNKNLNSAQKTERLQHEAVIRDEAIEKLLNVGQISKLKAYFINVKKQLEEKAKKPK